MTATTRKNFLKEELDEWLEILTTTLYNHERDLRIEQRLPVPRKEDTFLPQGKNAELLMLTMKVWCLRYHLPIEFILEFMLKKWHHQRRKVRGSAIVSFGLPTGLMVSARTRSELEETLKHMFPNNELTRSGTQMQPRVFRVGEFENLVQMVEQYSKSIAKSQRDFDRKEAVTKRARRNFRKV